MASETVIELERLLAPISEEQPAGEDLREDFSPRSTYYSIKDAQSSARTEERKRRESFDNEPDTSFRRDEWNPVLTSAQDILTEKSKDLEIAAWLVEGLLRAYGYPGLRDGFRLVRELVEKYWDDIYPRPDEDGVATTVAALTSLNGEEADGTIIWPLTNIAVTAGGYTLWQYKQASDLQLLEAEKREQRIAAGAVSFDMFQQAVRETPVSFYRELIEDVEQALEELENLSSVLDEKCGQDDTGYPLSPPTSRIRETLKECLDTIRSLARLVMPDETDDGDGGAEDGNGSGGAMIVGDGGPSVPAGSIQNREQAFRTLEKLADFFKKTEPHSPISYMLQQSVRFGRMELPELFSELISDSSTRNDLFRLVGIQKPED
jgi:type VI secretion system protein ImpA